MDAVAPAGLAQRIGVKRPRQQTGLGAENGVNGAGTSNTSNTNTLGAMKTSMSTSNLSSMGDFHAKNDFKRSASSGNLSSLSEGAELSSNRRRLDIINERRWSVVQDLALGWAVRGQVLENVDFESVARQLGHEHSARECRERAMDLKTKYRNAPWEDHEDDRLQHQMSLPESSLEVIASTAFPWRTPDQIKARWTYLQEQKKQEEQQKQQRQDEQQKKLLDAADEEQNRKAQQQQLELLQKLLMQQQNQQQHVSDEDSRKNDLLRSILQQNQQQQHQQSQQQTNSLGLESGSSQGTPQPMSGLSKDSDVSSAQFQMLQQFKADQENLMRKLELNQQMNAVLVQETARLFAQLQKQQQTSSTGNTQNQNIHMGPPISASSKNNSSNSLSSLGSAMALQARRPSGGASLATSTSPSPTQTPPDSPKPLSAFFSQVRQQQQHQQQSRGNSNNTGVRRNTNPIPNTSCSSLPLPEAQALFVQLLASQQQKQSPSQQQQQQQQPKPSQLWGSSSSTSSNHDAMDTSSDSADSAIQLKHHLLNQMLNPDLQRTLASRDAQAYLNQGYSAANQTPDNQTQTYGLFSNPAALAHALSAQMQRSRSISSNDDEMEDAHSGKDLQHNVPKSYSNGRPISGAVPGTENTGRWTTEEHARFLSGIAKYGTKHWTAIANVVKTRTVVQVRTHAQKFFKKRGILRPNADPDMARAIVEESVAAIANGKSRSPSPSSDL